MCTVHGPRDLSPDLGIDTSVLDSFEESRVIASLNLYLFRVFRRLTLLSILNLNDLLRRDSGLEN